MNRKIENTWRAISGQQQLKPMEAVVENLVNYMTTYADQPGYENYSDELFIEDVLYGLGAALSENNRYATGFMKFKEELLNHLIKDAPGAE
jgi:hypothetical protein